MLFAIPNIAQTPIIILSASYSAEVILYIIGLKRASLSGMPL